MHCRFFVMLSGETSTDSIGWSKKKTQKNSGRSTFESVTLVQEEEEEEEEVSFLHRSIFKTVESLRNTSLTSCSNRMQGHFPVIHRNRFTNVHYKIDTVRKFQTPFSYQ